MSLRTILSHAPRNHGVHSLASRCQNSVVSKRQITTSKSRPLASTAKVQSSFATALAQDVVDTTPYPFHCPTRDRKSWSPGTSSIPRGLYIREQVVGISSEGKETLEHNQISNSETLYWQKIPLWSDVTREDFIRYSWQVC